MEAAYMQQVCGGLQNFGAEMVQSSAALRGENWKLVLLKMKEYQNKVVEEFTKGVMFRSEIEREIQNYKLRNSFDQGMADHLFKFSSEKYPFANFDIYIGPSIVGYRSEYTEHPIFHLIIKDNKHAKGLTIDDYKVIVNWAFENNTENPRTLDQAKTRITAIAQEKMITRYEFNPLSDSGHRSPVYPYCDKALKNIADASSVTFVFNRRPLNYDSKYAPYHAGDFRTVACIGVDETKLCMPDGHAIDSTGTAFCFGISGQ